MFYTFERGDNAHGCYYKGFHVKGNGSQSPDKAFGNQTARPSKLAKLIASNFSENWPE